MCTCVLLLGCCSSHLGVTWNCSGQTILSYNEYWPTHTSIGHHNRRKPQHCIAVNYVLSIANTRASQVVYSLSLWTPTVSVTTTDAYPTSTMDPCTKAQIIIPIWTRRCPPLFLFRCYSYLPFWWPKKLLCCTRSWFGTGKPVGRQRQLAVVTTPIVCLYLGWLMMVI